MLEEKKLIYQNKTKSQIELEIKKLQEKHAVMKSAKDILQAIGYPSNSQIECYIGYTEAKMRDMRNAIITRFDKIYFNGEEVLKRENTNGDRDFYCDSPLQLVLALVEVIKDMDQEIKRRSDV
jgi:hypothetical protein